MREQSAVTALQQAGMTVAAAESLTGGQVCVALSEAAGSSAVFLGGAVTYAVSAKRDLLGLPEDLLTRCGPVDPDVARLMAEHVARRLGADIGVATTGVAGPEPHGGHDPGFAYLGWHTPDTSGAMEVQVSGDRETVRSMVTTAALEVISQCARSGRADASLMTVSGEFRNRE